MCVTVALRMERIPIAVDILPIGQVSATWESPATPRPLRAKYTYRHSYTQSLHELRVRTQIAGLKAKWCLLVLALMPGPGTPKLL